MGTKTKLKVIHENNDKLGLVFTPIDYFKDYKYSFFYDNGAFSAYVNEQEWNSDFFLTGLKEVMFYENKPDFCVLPDIVAGGKKSLKRSYTWLDILEFRYSDYRNWYLAVQDGISIDDIRIFMKMIHVSGIFVGGTIEWKLKTLPDWVDCAKEYNKKIHVGRIGTLKRILYCERLGVDSVDSSNFIKNKIHWNQLMDWLSNKKQIMLSNFITLK